MDDDVDPLVVSVRADRQALASDIAQMRAAIEGPLIDSAERAGNAIEGALLRAVRTGKFGFDDLRRTVLSVMSDIARSAISAALPGNGSGGLLSLASSIATSLLGAPGRATGGAVAPARPYLVGERGPELFVPTASGHIQPASGNRSVGRDIRITVNVGQGSGDAARMAASGRQIALAVRRAIETAER